MRPSPPQRSHGIARTTCPKTLRICSWIWPLPWQRSQVLIGVPGSAPLPLQCSQMPTASKLTSVSVPSNTSSSETSATASTSPPGDGPRAKPPPKASPKKVEKMSWMLEKPAACECQPPARSPSWPSWS